MATIPVEIGCVLVFCLGIVNLVRFYKVQKLGGALIQIYVFSLTALLFSFLYMAFVFKSNKWSIFPFLTVVYSKTFFGLAYQSSVFSLKQIVQFYFVQKESTNKSDYTDKKTRNAILMLIWMVALFVCYLVDSGYNYFYFVFFEYDPNNGEVYDDQPHYREAASYVLSF